MAKEVTISLNKAQKYITKITKEIQSLSIYAVSQLTIDVSDKPDEVLKLIDSNVKDSYEKLDLYMCLNEDLRKLKSLVFKTNIKNGTHELLNELNLKRKLVVIYQGLVQNLKRQEVRNASTVDLEFISDKIKMARDNGTKVDRINIAVLSRENIEAKLKTLSKEVSVMEDKLASANVQSIITVELSDGVIELLNLD